MKAAAGPPLRTENMQTNLLEHFKDTPEGQEADSILRTCVHCGFCLATCPTYQLTGNELDSPRGRIYLMKQMMEGQPVSAEKTLFHLDRCLTCRNCETTCPSGVKYGRLVDIGRAMAEDQVERPASERAVRYTLNKTLPHQGIFAPAMRLGQMVRPFLPAILKKSVPPRQKLKAVPPPAKQLARTMILLEGCVQPSMAPNINDATRRVLARLGIQLVSPAGAGCCGALSYHLNYQGDGLDYMRRNIDAWWPLVEQGAEAIVMNASGCGVTVKEYGHYLRLDPQYAAKAEKIAELTMDISEIIINEKERLVDLVKAKHSSSNEPRVAFHPPCTLQHGQKIRGVVEDVLQAAGITLTLVPDSHLCCGSAGTYSILQKDLSQQLLKRKVEALESGNPEMVLSANIGCITHLQSGTSLKVRHWIELVDDMTA